MVKKIHLREINYLCDPSDLKGDFFVKVRSTGNLLPCTVSNGGAVVTLNHGEAGISPGQACVFYKSDETGIRVFGGGWIDRAEK